MTIASDTVRDSLVTEIFGFRRHEFGAAAWSFAYFFCILCSYYLIRPVREMMGVGSGPNTIPYLFIGTFLAMMIASPIFGLIASRYPRRSFLPWVYLFFISNILVFWFVFSQARGSGEDYVWLGRAFFVWLSVFNLFVVSVFWSFMADIWTREQGRRLFGFITAGGSIGALLGGTVTSALVTTIGFQNLFPISATVLFLGVLCIGRLKQWVHEEHEDEIDKTVESEKPLGGNPFAGITHLFSSKFFLAIAAKSIIASLLGTALYMFAAELVADAIPGDDQRTQFFSNMNNAQNLLALLFQLFVVKQVVVRFGVGRSLALFPVFSIVGFAILAFDPTLMAVAVLTVGRRALGFGFAKPSTDMLYSVVTPEEKYKTKNFIDTAIYRGGDVVGTWTIRLFQVLGMGMSAISALMVPFALASAVLSLWLGRDYKTRAKSLAERGVQ